MQDEYKNMNHNPAGRGGFGDHPENRSNGGWKREMVFSYQYKRFLSMSIEEFNEFEKLFPEDKRTVVEDLAYKTVQRAENSLRYVKEITNRTEGKAKQLIDNPIYDGRPLTILHLKHPEALL